MLIRTVIENLTAAPPGRNDTGGVWSGFCAQRHCSDCLRGARTVERFGQEPGAARAVIGVAATQALWTMSPVSAIVAINAW